MQPCSPFIFCLFLMAIQELKLESADLNIAASFDWEGAGRKWQLVEEIVSIHVVSDIVSILMSTHGRV